MANLDRPGSLVKPNRFFAGATIALAVVGVPTLFFDYHVALIAFGAAALFGTYLWLLHRATGQGSPT